MNSTDRKYCMAKRYLHIQHRIFNIYGKSIISEHVRYRRYLCCNFYRSNMLHILRQTYKYISTHIKYTPLLLQPFRTHKHTSDSTCLTIRQLFFRQTPNCHQQMQGHFYPTNIIYTSSRVFELSAK